MCSNLVCSDKTIDNAIRDMYVYMLHMLKVNSAFKGLNLYRMHRMLCEPQSYVM